MRAPAGTRIEETEQVFADVEAAIRHLIPKEEIQLVIDSIGQPQPINLAFTDSVTIGASDGEILVALNRSPADREMDEDAPRARCRANSQA